MRDQNISAADRWVRLMSPAGKMICFFGIFTWLREEEQSRVCIFIFTFQWPNSPDSLIRKVTEVLNMVLKRSLELKMWSNCIDGMLLYLLWFVIMIFVLSFGKIFMYLSFIITSHLRWGGLISLDILVHDDIGFRTPAGNSLGISSIWQIVLTYHLRNREWRHPQGSRIWSHTSHSLGSVLAVSTVSHPSHKSSVNIPVYFSKCFRVTQK